MFNRPVGFAMSVVEKRGIKDIQHEATGVDISDNGLGLITKVPLTQGSILKLFIPINKITMPVFAVVKWTKPHMDKLRAGLQFLV